MLEYLSAGTQIYLYVLAALLGLVLGSALNCLSFRMAHEQKWSGAQRSCCPACGHALGALDLIPLFSYLFLKGRCRYCGKPISPRYPITEGLLALCFVSLLARFGLSADLVTAAILCACLLCLSLVDLDTQIIPDRFLVLPAGARAIQLVLEGGLSGLARGVLPGLVIGGGVLCLSLVMDRVLGRDTMGGGDIKLLALLGMFLPFSQCLVLLILACVLGIVLGAVLLKVNPGSAFPFGPALAAAAWITLLVGEPFVSWYLSLFL